MYKRQLLSNAAVELDGLWQMDLHPGQKNSEGEILRYAPIGGQSSIILSNTKYPEESFRLLKWWMSTEVQKEFQFRLETTYGKQYFWNSANNQAFMAVSYTHLEWYNSLMEIHQLVSC